MAICLKGATLPEKRIREVAELMAEWATLNGVSVRPGNGTTRGVAMCAPFTLLPSVLPAETVKEARSTMIHFNRMMHRAAMDHEFLTDCFKTLIEVDSFIAGLWNIYIKVREAGIKQPIMLGLFRNDFMMDCDADIPAGQLARADQLKLKQIEFNSMSAAGNGIIQQLALQHRFALDICGVEYTEREMPDNRTASNFCAGLVQAWNLYGNPEAVIIMLVTSSDRYAVDQYWMAVRVAELNPRIRFLRKTFSDLNEQASLDNQGRLFVDGDEVGLVYLRHGYIPKHYPTKMEWNVRLMLEMSTAIKCPSIQHHLITSKKVQQKLVEPGMVERFIKDEDVVERLRATFVHQYSMDLDAEGDKAVDLAVTYPDKYVMKPSREGGGNNLYDEEITDFLTKHGQSKERCAYILMERIFPWQQQNYLHHTVDTPLVLSNVVNEIGIHGVFIGTADEEIENYECGFSMRSKAADLTEGGILAGYSAIDTPFLG